MMRFVDGLSGKARPEASPRESWSTADWRALLQLLALALVLRITVGLLFPHIDHADEVFQVTEQAHRLIVGHGIVPWEFRSGVRGWLWPGIVAGVLWPVEHLTSSPQAIRIAVLTLCSLISLGCVAAAFALGRQISRQHAILAGFVAAVWFEFLYFALHPLTAAVATSFLLGGLYMMSIAPSRKRAFWAGVLAGCCFVLRFHLAPGLLVAVIWYARDKLKERWLPIVLGAAFPLALYGLVDWLTWGIPFESIFNNFDVNLIVGRSSTYGVSPFVAYVAQILHDWGGTFAILAGLIVLGARRFPMWLAVALAILLSHSLIGHKEYRFIFPAIACLITLAAIGSGDVIACCAEGLKTARIKHAALLLPAALGIWVLTSEALAMSSDYVGFWTNARPSIDAFDWLHRQRKLCGLALLEVPWYATPGYSGLRRDVPLYQLHADRLPAANVSSASYNYILADKRARVPKGFELKKCFAAMDQPTECVYERPGRCVPAPDQDINQWLIKRDE